VTNDFDKNGYVHLKGFLDLDNCKELVNVLKELIKNKKTTKDIQCPLSEAIHGTVTFDTLLQDLLPHFEKVSGKKLYPTYSYARLYKPGEELKKHTDRPACEISATITLGFKGNPWSIYMAGNKIDMQVGDAVLYRGMDIEHWREKYTEGNWQAQVFLHYVDAEGPHADQKYDGRTSLNVYTKKPSLLDCAVYENSISNDFCNNIINRYIQNDIENLPAFLGSDNNINKDIRDVSRVLIPTQNGIGATLVSTGFSTNNYLWKYHITHAHQAEFLIYNKNNHYVSHVDMLHQHSDETRKLTVIGILNDDFEGGKFYIQTTHKKWYPPQTKGTIIVFPSYLLHGVEPVTKGIRYSCVTWLVGPYFK